MDKFKNALSFKHQFDRFSLTSQREGVLTSLEAMLIGILLSTKAGVVSDIIIDGEKWIYS
jgi:hypothetical protein